MPVRTLDKFKSVVFSRLNTDGTLQTLLAGPGKIKHANPLAIAQYPCVTYNVLAERDDPYNETLPAGISESLVEFQVFSQGTSSSNADAIEDRIYALFHAVGVVASGCQILSSFRTGRKVLFEPENNIYRVISRYRMVNYQV